MLNHSPGSPETKADKIVKVTIWKPLDIQIDRRAFHLQLRAADDVDFALPNRQRLQRVVILLALASEPLLPPACPERVGKLGDGENTIGVEFLALLCGHIRQQAEIIFFLRLLPATSLKFALGAVRVQYDVWRCRIGQQSGDSLETLSHLACHSRGLHLQRGVVVTVDNSTDTDFTSQRFREREGIEGQQQFVVLAQLVGKDESNRDELRRLGPAFGGY